MGLWAQIQRPVIGMLHAPALPGAPRNALPFRDIIEFVLRDAEALVTGGVDGLMLENFGDAPFFPDAVPPATVAQLAILADRVRQRFDQPLGINVLRNDARSALAIAQTAGAQFIRVNVLCGARVTDQGVIAGAAHDLLRARNVASSAPIAIFADVDVKHSSPLGIPRAIADEVQDLVLRGGADAVIVSGAGTGKPVDIDHLREVREACCGRRVLVGSGVSTENIRQLATAADGFIVGSSLKQHARIGTAVCIDQVRRLVSLARD